MTISLPRRERRIQARRTQILEAAVKIFAEKGYQTTTTKEIAEAAELAEGTIYNYFESKSDVLVAFLGELSGADKMEALLQASVDVPLRDLFRHVLRFRMAHAQPHMEAMLRVMPEIMAYPDLRKIYHDRILAPAMRAVEAHLQQRIERGELKPTNAALLARVLSTMMMGLAFFQFVGDEVAQSLQSTPELLESVLEQVIFEGILAQPAQE